jgi:hypothetical protein
MRASELISNVQKLKCNEQRPHCGRCVERKTRCEYKSDPWHGHSSLALAYNKQYSQRVIYATDSATATEFSRVTITPVVEHSPRTEQDSPEKESASQPHDEDHMVVHEGDEDVHDAESPDAEMQLQRIDNARPPAIPLTPHLDLNMPLFAEITQPYNRRALLNHFTTELSTLMTFSGDSGNPFRELVLPMCERSRPLLFAVLALSSAHLEFKGVENKEASINLHTQALHLLSEALARQERGHALVTAIIMLIYYETV